MLNSARKRFEARAFDLEDCAVLHTAEDPTGQTLHLVPNNPRAIGITLFDYGDGTCGVCFTGEENGISDEMIYEARDVDFYVDAAVAGKVRYLHGPGRRSVQVDTGDGYETMDTEYQPWSLFPMFGWRRRAEVTQFEPYRAQ
ncbi:hypothetical protein [Aeromicrobium wangtongii]|uniref:Uncharacterized protein n=1 Tax=Aeromicrobium wangtongii TaxID=2969247 RepID=A0ABY5ME33_9ACTN|nr:hypothetical protein [Aeromicrobium wangtongii]MCD9197798.1 hypothetical protein [Aeromicrobium wangtongii]UUP15280.1 hypothetical protein NQV15_08205 [Aeromicrobium wangtongii]